MRFDCLPFEWYNYHNYNDNYFFQIKFRRKQYEKIFGIIARPDIFNLLLCGLYENR